MTTRTLDPQPRMQLRFIKLYRTPVGLRAFARLFILLLPILYGEYGGYEKITVGTVLPQKHPISGDVSTPFPFLPPPPLFSRPPLRPSPLAPGTLR